MDVAQALEAQEIARHRIINETIASYDSLVQRFYAGTTVFVTGASGFLGKQLVEKLFRACEIKKVFILLRPKKQRTPQERLKRMLEDPVYETLHKLQPHFVNKIVAVSGDVTEPRLGINDADWLALTAEVEIIFHGAATINFVEPLKKATLTNVRGTKEMLQLGKACKKLKSFVHISTAYSHATEARVNQQVLEKFYDTPIDPNDLLNMAETYDEATLDNMMPTLIKGWPNTYAFTKAVAEEVIRTMSEDLPICIVRPAVVVCAYREPTPGWLDKTNAFGPTGIVAGCGLGILHVLLGDAQNYIDLVPVDVVNNASIAAAYETTLRRERGESDVKIYTVTSTKNPVTLRKLIDTISNDARHLAPTNAVWYGFAIAATNPILYAALCWFFHYIPGYICDGLLLLLGKKPMLINTYSQVDKLSTVFSYYMRSYWEFGDANLRDLYSHLSPTDRIIFNFNVDTIDWTSFILLWCIGCRKYIFRDGLTDTDKGYKKQLRLRYIHYIIMAGYIFLLYKIASIFTSLVYVPLYLVAVSA